MRSTIALLLPLLVMTACSSAPKPPSTRVDAVTETLHGVEIRDPYRWLEDQDSPETRAWIEAQNAHTEQMLRRAPEYPDLEARLEQLLRLDDADPPLEAGGRYFYMKRAAGAELPVLHMRRGLEGQDEVLIDPHPLSEDRTTSVELRDASDDGKLLLYGVRVGGEDEIELVAYDIDSRREIDRLPKARILDQEIEKDRGGLYYGRMTAAGPRVYHHRFGQKEPDREVFGEGFGTDRWISFHLVDDDRTIIFEASQGWDRSELYLMPVGREARLLTGDTHAVFTPVRAGGQMLVLTDWKAPKGRLMSFTTARPDPASWREVIPEGDAKLEEIRVAGGRVFAHYIENAVSRVRVFTPDGKSQGEIPFPTQGTVRAMGGHWRSPGAFIAFTSFQLPLVIYHATGSDPKPWFDAMAPVDPAAFTVRQVSYASKDGTRIPMFLLHGPDAKPGTPRPTLLSGYGGFNVSRTPQYSSYILSWVERGGVFAMPNLRGGGEFGEEWHQAGILDRKQNVFDDFIAAAEWLIAEGYTSPEKLAISGRSNGGLLVGAALTQRPELFRAVICGVPLLDMLRYHKFLLGALWVPEYGSADDPEQFRYLHAYSPYHRVKPGTAYPAVLFVTGDADTRVAPLHARKMAALLQSATGSGHPVLLRYDTKFGHTSSLPVSKQVEDMAAELRFLLWQTGG